MKKKPTDNKKVNYQYIEKNIYKTGDRYRVRVAGVSCNAGTLRKAREFKKVLKSNLNTTPLW